MKMTCEELANKLNGREYGKEITREESRAAKEAGLLVVFGYSDDLIMLRGVIDEEVGAWSGRKFAIGEDFSIVSENERDYDPIEHLFGLTAEWNPWDDVSWYVNCTEPEKKTFQIFEDGELYCVGVVVDMNAIRQRKGMQ